MQIGPINTMFTYLRNVNFVYVRFFGSFSPKYPSLSSLSSALVSNICCRLVGSSPAADGHRLHEVSYHSRPFRKNSFFLIANCDGFSETKNSSPSQVAMIST